jgi:nitrogen regulatory protein PII
MVRIGEKLFSHNHGFVTVEDVRGKGKNQEFKISILDKEYWLSASKVQ